MTENGNGSQVETVLDESEELADNAVSTTSTTTGGARSGDEGNIQSDGALVNYFKMCENLAFLVLNVLLVF